VLRAGSRERTATSGREGGRVRIKDGREGGREGGRSCLTCIDLVEIPLQARKPPWGPLLLPSLPPSLPLLLLLLLQINPDQFQVHLPPSRASTPPSLPPSFLPFIDLLAVLFGKRRAF